MDGWSKHQKVKISKVKSELYFKNFFSHQAPKTKPNQKGLPQKEFYKKNKILKQVCKSDFVLLILFQKEFNRLSARNKAKKTFEAERVT